MPARSLPVGSHVLRNGDCCRPLRGQRARGRQRPSAGRLLGACSVLIAPMLLVSAFFHCPDGVGWGPGPMDHKWHGSNPLNFPILIVDLRVKRKAALENSSLVDLLANSSYYTGTLMDLGVFLLQLRETSEEFKLNCTR